MVEYVRVTDEVKPRREYSIPASTYDPEIHSLLADRPAARPDGTPLPPKYTPSALAGESGGGEGYDGLSVSQLKDEIDARNGDRGDDQHISKSGNKADLIAALQSDDDARLVEQDTAPAAADDATQASEA